MREHNIIEKIVFGLGIIIIVAIFGYLSYQIYRPRKQPPQLTIMSAYQPDMKNYGFEVVVENFGEETAANADIKLTLYQDGKPAESGSISFAYIPVKSREKGWIVFHAERKPTDSLVVSSLTFSRNNKLQNIYSDGRILVITFLETIIV